MNEITTILFPTKIKNFEFAEKLKTRQKLEEITKKTKIKF